MPADVSAFITAVTQDRSRGVAAVLQAVNEFGEHVIGDAQNLCPVDTGFLVASGTTLPAEIRGDAVEKTIGFNAIYAAAVHEVLTANHPIGQAKYLETAINENAPKLNSFVAASMKGAMQI